TMHNLTRLNAGYDTRTLLTMSVTIPGMEKWYDFHAQVLPRISALPGVRKAAMGWGLPLTGNEWTGPVELEEQPQATALREKLNLPIRCVTPEYFDTLGMKITAGRGFVQADAFYGPNGKT